jgi:hypothetical protein
LLQHSVTSFLASTAPLGLLLLLLLVLLCWMLEQCSLQLLPVQQQPLVGGAVCRQKQKLHIVHLH